MKDEGLILSDLWLTFGLSAKLKEKIQNRQLRQVLVSNYDEFPPACFANFEKATDVLFRLQTVFIDPRIVLQTRSLFTFLLKYF